MCTLTSTCRSDLFNYLCFFHHLFCGLHLNTNLHSTSLLWSDFSSAEQWEQATQQMGETSFNMNDKQLRGARIVKICLL